MESTAAPSPAREQAHLGADNCRRPDELATSFASITGGLASAWRPAAPATEIPVASAKRGLSPPRRLDQGADHPAADGIGFVVGEAQDVLEGEHRFGADDEGERLGEAVADPGGEGGLAGGERGLDQRGAAVLAESAGRRRRGPAGGCGSASRAAPARWRGSSRRPRRRRGAGARAARSQGSPAKKLSPSGMARSSAASVRSASTPGK